MCGIVSFVIFGSVFSFLIPTLHTAGLPVAFIFALYKAIHLKLTRFLFFYYGDKSAVLGVHTVWHACTFATSSERIWCMD